MTFLVCVSAGLKAKIHEAGVEEAGEVDVVG